MRDSRVWSRNSKRLSSLANFFPPSLGAWSQAVEENPKWNIWMWNSCLLPLWLNEFLCETIHMKMCPAYRSIFMQIKHIFLSNVLQEDSFWNRGKRYATRRCVINLSTVHVLSICGNETRICKTNKTIKTTQKH